MMRFPVLFSMKHYIELSGLAEAIGVFALQSPYDWPKSWRLVYARVWPLGLLVRLAARVLLWMCFLIPWGIVQGVRDHADRIRQGNVRDPNVDTY